MNPASSDCLANDHEYSPLSSQKASLSAARDPVRVALVGIGEIGKFHARNLLEGHVARGNLAAVVHPDVARHAAFAPALGFTSLDALIEARAADALIVATPQSSHLQLGQQALAAGLHVMMEKPLTIDHASGKLLIETPLFPGQKFALMVNQRVAPTHLALRQAIRNGCIGRVQRVLWVATNWFRSQRYYDDRPERGTWQGEGGGVLITQALHPLDLYRWIFGRPATVMGHCGFGRHHAIEAEDDVTAYFEYADGMHTTFISSTGESPGTNRIEVIGDGGRLVLENEQLTLWQNVTYSSEFIRSSSTWFDAPESKEIILPQEPALERTRHYGGQHAHLLENFIDAILDNVPLIAPAEEGIWSLELINAIQLSAWQGRSVSLPFDNEAYAEALAVAVASVRDKNSAKRPEAAY
ncbi:MAG: Gfo/Idh/MocA family oxidoreductase [Luteolibacter sp.]